MILEGWTVEDAIAENSYLSNAVLLSIDLTNAVNDLSVALLDDAIPAAEAIADNIVAFEDSYEAAAVVLLGLQ